MCIYTHIYIYYKVKSADTHTYTHTQIYIYIYIYIYIHTLLTDHYSIDFTITMPYTTPKRTTITYRNIKKINYDDFKNDINKSVISCHLTAYSLTELLTDLLNKHAPLKTNYLTKHDNQPWFNSDLGKLKHIFRTQNNKYLKHPTIINRTQLQKSRYTYRTLLN